MDVHPGELLQIIALSSAAAIGTELLMWLWAYRKDSFRTLRVRHLYPFLRTHVQTLHHLSRTCGALLDDIHTYLQVNLDRQARKLDEIKAQPHAPGPQGKAAKQKKVEKLDRSIKMMLTKELGPMKFKQSLLVRGPCIE